MAPAVITEVARRVEAPGRLRRLSGRERAAAMRAAHEDQQRREADHDLGRVDRVEGLVGAPAGELLASTEGSSPPSPRRRRSASASVGSTSSPADVADVGLDEVEWASMWATRAVDRRLDALEHRLGVDAEEHDEPSSGAMTRPSPPAQVGQSALSSSGSPWNTRW
jgi:hypothetical protein